MLRRYLILHMRSMLRPHTHGGDLRSARLRDNYIKRGSAMRPNQVRRNLFDNMKATGGPGKKLAICVSIYTGRCGTNWPMVFVLNPDAGPRRSHSGREAGKSTLHNHFMRVMGSSFLDNINWRMVGPSSDRCTLRETYHRTQGARWTRST